MKALAPNGGVINSRLLLEEVNAETIVTNAGTNSVMCTIYDIICRRDCSQGASSVTDLVSPLSAWRQGVSDEASAGTWQVLGSTPFESDLFNQFYKVKQTTRVSLSGGGTHRHKVFHRVNHVIHGERIKYAAYGIADVTLYTVVMFHGQPCHDSTTTANVSVSGASLDHVSKTSYRYRWVQDNSTIWTRSDNMGTIGVGAQYVNEPAGQVQDVAGFKPTILLS